jgi:LysR family cys regulon transcriptional activator
MNFQQLRYVREASRNELNLTEVSQILNTSQSGVSKQIRELEIELGVEIFVRKGKRLTGLTKVGEGAVKLIERILLETENLKRYAEQFSGEAHGRLVIATTHNQARYVLPEVIPLFAREFPGVQLELRQVTPQQAASSVLEGEADIAIAT